MITPTPHPDLGFASDIHHDHLSGGRFDTSAKVIRKPSLPKPCPQCTCLIPVGVKVCPACGFERKLVSGVYEREGVLVEFTGGFRKKGDRKSYTYSQVEKERFYSQLKGYALTKGYQPGWAFYKYKEKFKVEPSWAMKSVPAMAPGPEVSAWIRHTQIQWAKSRKNPNNANETSDASEFELLALRLYVHGPEGLDGAWSAGFSVGRLGWRRGISFVAGFELSEICSLAGRAHRKGCACWECVIALNRAVRRSTNRKTSFVRPQRIAPQPHRADDRGARRAPNALRALLYSSLPNCHHFCTQRRRPRLKRWTSSGMRV